LERFWPLLQVPDISGPVLDLACGDGHNGIFLACQGIPVICCDKSPAALARADAAAAELGVAIQTWEVDLEQADTHPLPSASYGGILVFRYLHRPLIPDIRRALLPQGLLFYETFTIQQPAFGKPHNPDYLLKPGELLSWFEDWHILHFFEGIRSGPQRAVAELVCRKP
jgi:SAM-dependent methyltransferase